MRDLNWYEMFGLTVTSELELPEAIASEQPSQLIDIVEIKEGPAPESLAGGRKIASWIEVAGDECLYRLENVCRMHVIAGRSITIDRFRGASDGDVRAFLFGSGLGTICHQRKLVPLHVSAVRSPIGTIAFTGPSGAGKSTIAAALEELNNWPIVCDDMAVIDPADQNPVLHVGVRRKKLWRDAITALGFGGRPMERDVSRLDKFHLPLVHAAATTAPPIVYLFDLAWGDEISIRELPPASRFALSMNAIYRPYLTPIFNDLSIARRVAVSLAQTMRACSLTRPRCFEGLQDLVEALGQHCKSLG